MSIKDNDGVLTDASSDPPGHWKITIQLLSDWHVGTGQGGAGGVDRLVARDGDGLPYLPAKQLKGLWRDACERVAWGLDDGAKGGWSALAAHLFGSGAGRGHLPEKSHGLVLVSDAQLPQPWGDALGSAPLDSELGLMGQGLALTRFGVAINGATCTARDDMLREIEVARAGLSLWATVGVTVAVTWEIELLLLAGLENIDHIGAKRRRGLGRCEVSVDSLEHRVVKLADVDVSEIVRVAKGPGAVAATAVKDPVADPAPPSAAGSATDPHSPSAKWRQRARVRLYTQQPVLATRAVLGNTVIGHAFVPGAALLPLVLPSCGPVAARLVRDARVVVTDATLVVDGSRAHPAPLGIISPEKGKQWEITNAATDLFATDPSTPPDPRSTPVRGWVTHTTQGYMRTEPPAVARAHAVIDDALQRTADNSMFVYQAIPSGTVLEFEVWDDGSLDGAWQPDTVPGSASIGRSRLSGYGAVRIEVRDPETDNERTSSDSLVCDVVITLHSDTCIVDDLGLPDPSAKGLAGWLADRLNVDIEVTRARVAVIRRDGWFGSLAAPKTSIIALAAGSQIQLRTSNKVGLERVRELLKGGIGTFCVEGFGRCTAEPFTMNGSAPRVHKSMLLEAQPEPPGSSALAARQVDPELWDTMRREVWRDEIRRRVGGLSIATRAKLLAPGVSQSQLGSLRAAARRDHGAVQRWVASTAGRASFKKAWGEARLAALGALASGDNGKVADWLNQAAESSATSVPQDLGGNSVDEVLSLVLGELIHRQSLDSLAATTSPQARE